MIRSLGESRLPVAYAGQASWQRPHSVQENESIICFHVRSSTVPMPKRMLLLGHVLVEAQRLEPAARARAPEVDVDRGGGDVQVLGVGEVGEEAEDHQHVRPHEHALERLGRRAVAEERRRGRSRAGDQPRVVLVQAERDPRRVPERAASSTMPAISARIRSASPRWLPSKRRGRDTLRIRTRDRDADQHEHGEDVDEQGEPALAPSHGERRARGRRRRSSPCRIVGKRTRKPQKMNACIRPGTSRCSSFCWPERRRPPRSQTARGTSSSAVDARACPSARAGRAAARGGRRARRRRRGRRRARRRSTGDGMRPSPSADLGRDRGHDLVQVADHRVVGARQDRRLGVGVDRPGSSSRPCSRPCAGSRR